MSVQIKIIIFIIMTAGFVWLSWRSLGNFRSHGFYRFFVFESVTALILINLNYWFDEPFSIRQIISWVLLMISVIMLIYGVLVLRKIGKPDSQRNDSSLIGIEKTTELVTVGAYRYIRHPIYSAGFYGAWGAFFKHLSWESVSLAVITTVFLTMTAKMEEAENVRFFGDVYRDYMKRTRMFVPFLF